MDFCHSRLIHPSEYETEGLCDNVPLRMHKESIKEDMGAIRCQKDWSRLVGPIGFHKGGLDAKWSIVSTCVPECLPDRLETISYANELAFLYDDETESYNQDQLDASNDAMEATFLEAVATGAIKSKQAGLQQLQAQILDEMKAIDSPRALKTMAAWAEFLRLAAGRQHGRHFPTLEEYILYRSIDVGKMFWYGLVTFGLAITIPPHELPLLDTLLLPAWVALSLQNDIFSWPKERDAARRKGDATVVSAVYVLMHEHSISESEALLLCRKNCREYVAEYVQIVRENEHNLELSDDSRRYMVAIMYTLSGNAVWSIHCPRYHEEAVYNDFQLSLMTEIHAEMRDYVEEKQRPTLGVVDAVVEPVVTSPEPTT